MNKATGQQAGTVLNHGIGIMKRAGTATNQEGMTGEQSTALSALRCLPTNPRGIGERMSQPQPFNPGFRPGHAKALAAAYRAYCETCADQSEGPSRERARAYVNISDALLPLFPTIEERENEVTE